jgi:hypothetical protein
MRDFMYGFRIEGPTSARRRLVDADAAFVGHLGCDKRVDVNNEAYLSAFTFGRDFREHLEQAGSVRNFAGACWSRFAWFDVDDAADFTKALGAARRLAALVVTRYQIDSEALLIFLSGSKGFHLGIPSALWNPTPATNYHLVVRRFCQRLAEQAGVTIDGAVYDRVRAFRAPNSRHPVSGLYKRPLAFDELLQLKPAAIRKLATEPLPVELPPEPAENSVAKADWQAAVESVGASRRMAEPRSAAPETAHLNLATLEFIKDGTVLKPGERAKGLFAAACNLADFGCPPALAHALLTAAGLDSGLPPREVRRQIDCGLKAGRSK